MGSNLKPDVRRSQSRNRQPALSAEKARRMLDWRPEYEIDDALRETIAWYEGHLGRAAVSVRQAAYDAGLEGSVHVCFSRPSCKPGISGANSPTCPTSY